MAWNRIVDLYWLLDRRQGSPLIESRLSTQAVDTLEFIQADNFLLRHHFFNSPASLSDSPIPVRLAENTYLVFAAKRTTGLAAEELLFKAEGFVEVADPDHAGEFFYQARLDLNRTALNAALAALDATTRTLAITIDLENEAPDNTERLTKQVDAVIRRQAYAGEANPGTDLDPYPAPGNLLLRAVAGKYRFKPDGTFQLWNPTQALYHAISLVGAADAEQLVIGAGEV